jgi:predicted phosphodiesterase
MLFENFYILSAILGLVILLLFLKDYLNKKKIFLITHDLGWHKHEPEVDHRVNYTVLLIGDAGAPKLDGNDSVLNLISREIEDSGPNHATIFLGDNIYPRGLPPQTHQLRSISEQRIKAQMDIFKSYVGNVFFISGNHDWNKGKSNGFAYLQRQEKFVNSYMQRGHVFLPENGCPGPTDIHLSEDLVVIFINTQWWIQRGLRPIGKQYGCGAKNEDHFFRLLDEMLEANKSKNILIAAHHPLFSNALHGGRFTTKHHIFPLTAVHKRLYLPLPVAGSLYPLYRKMFGAYEDMSHPRYKRMRKRLLQIIKKHKNIIYSAGHDHNLQYFRKENNHFIVSGSGSKVSYVKKGRRASFTHAHTGLFKLEFLSNGEIWMQVLEPNLNNETVIVYRKKLGINQNEEAQQL